MKNDKLYPVCDCRFTVKALGDFIDTFGRPPVANNVTDCERVGKLIGTARDFNAGLLFERMSGKFAIVCYWKCRRVGLTVPLGGNKVGILPLDK
jgi:hypothetical protein